MEIKNGLTLMDATKFESWIATKQVARRVMYVQQMPQNNFREALFNLPFG
jgi:hypothetical protein